MGRACKRRQDLDFRHECLEHVVSAVSHDGPCITVNTESEPNLYNLFPDLSSSCPSFQQVQKAVWNTLICGLYDGHMPTNNQNTRFWGIQRQLNSWRWFQFLSEFVNNWSICMPFCLLQHLSGQQTIGIFSISLLNFHLSMHGCPKLWNWLHQKSEFFCHQMALCVRVRRICILRLVIYHQKLSCSNCWEIEIQGPIQTCDWKFARVNCNFQREITYRC